MYSIREILNELNVEEIELIIVNNYLPKTAPLHMNLGASYTKILNKEKYLTLSDTPKHKEITPA